MDAHVRVGSIAALSVVLSAAAVTSGYAQQASFDQRGFGQQSLRPLHGSRATAQNQLRHRDLAFRKYNHAASDVPRLPFLIDTNGRQCMGFGRLFPIDQGGRHSRPTVLLEQRVTNRQLRLLGEAMVEKRTEDAAFDSEMPAGYTFLAQFIDHDITFDTTSMLNRTIRDDEFENARTVALDLDSVYGRGPEQDPYLYNLPYLRVGALIGGCGAHARFDLLRSRQGNAAGGPRGGAARALIGDPRNDENFIVAQLHAAFIAFHNRFVDLLVAHRQGRSGRHCDTNRNCGSQSLIASLSRSQKQEIFESARDHVIYYYHRVIMEDFLPRLIGEARLRDILQNGRSFFFANRHGEVGRAKEHLFIPIEFAVAAFRYGHSQVRERYQLRHGVRTTLLEAAGRGGGGSPAFQPVRTRHLVDWHYFFPIGSRKPYGFNFARKIDPEITPFLHDLGRSRVVGRNDVVSLPARNLVRGKSFRLPSGQAIAERVMPVLQRRGLLSNSSRNALHDRSRRSTNYAAFILRADRRTRRFIRHGKTPLWYYILQEAAVFGAPSGFGSDGYPHAVSSRREGIRYASLSRGAGPRHRFSHRRSPQHGERSDRGHTLGPVGATLVGEVLTGLIEHYRAKPGKGLSFHPIVRAAVSAESGAPLTLTPVPHVNRGFFGRYLMRNLLIDAGLGRPLRSVEVEGDACRYRHDDNDRGRAPLPQHFGNRTSNPMYAESRLARTHRARQHKARGKDSGWRKRAFRTD